MLNSGPSRRRGWILRCRQLEPGVSRAPYALWDPIFGHVAPEKLKIMFFAQPGLRHLTRKLQRPQDPNMTPGGPDTRPLQKFKKRLEGAQKKATNL